eukprot:CAMPEP_0115129170 /NCGR_PEP_ID=MMETSP0227-20121206/51618_1 /TAXON_ID=89957 /ORGANISM="Polarella glacialis, Strain CCMP 1383" /LENGTH=63 /DNA_ID=CAMNT_0002533961 /DNA_START=74 /DNA_END=262 /DNA_ORIENTATION=-
MRPELDTSRRCRKPEGRLRAAGLLPPAAAPCSAPPPSQEACAPRTCPASRAPGKGHQLGPFSQ